eukprot:TRINITY_DN15275_c0_g1_i1.p1 TRINITY_DN15275_c0_g1~~TRINITY_DN15275_c0_g1_i1.p1  ORF type:complete len:342 (-),score=-8.55 TRINITY_DN15275_c0_g1_i1:118-1056(-)
MSAEPSNPGTATCTFPRNVLDSNAALSQPYRASEAALDEPYRECDDLPGSIQPYPAHVDLTIQSPVPSIDQPTADLSASRPAHLPRSSYHGRQSYVRDGTVLPAAVASQLPELNQLEGAEQRMLFGNRYKARRLIAAGHFGAVYELQTRRNGEVEWVVKVVKGRVAQTFYPYVVTREYGGCTLLISRIGEELKDLLRNAAGLLGLLHRACGRVHGDVHPGNLVQVVTDQSADLPWPLNVVPPGWQLVQDPVAWQRLHLIDPDLSSSFGTEKQLTNYLHEDPRKSCWSAMDDLVGLLNSVLQLYGVLFTRVGG